jgi:TonB family protein
MNRIQKKCFIGSMILHGVLAITLILGPAFLSREPAPAPALQVVPDPDHITDDPTHGGDRNVQPPPPVADPQPPQPPPVVQQPVPPKVEPVKETVRPDPPKVAAVDPKGTDPKPAPKKSPQISTNLVRNTKSPTTIASNNAADALAKKRAEAARKAAIARAISSINNGVSSATKVDIDPGPDDGGALSANYRDLVGSKYQEMWDPPNSPATDNAIVKASVTIASDGRVISARITVPSGDAEVDASVKRTLDQVTYIAPFPKGSTDKERTYPIKFDLKAKRLT